MDIDSNTNIEKTGALIHDTVNSCNVQSQINDLNISISSQSSPGNLLYTEHNYSAVPPEATHEELCPVLNDGTSIVQCDSDEVVFLSSGYCQEIECESVAIEDGNVSEEAVTISNRKDAAEEQSSDHVEMDVNDVCNTEVENQPIIQCSSAGTVVTENPSLISKQVEPKAPVASFSNIKRVVNTDPPQIRTTRKIKKVKRPPPEVVKAPSKPKFSFVIRPEIIGSDDEDSPHSGKNEKAMEATAYVDTEGATASAGNDNNDAFTEDSEEDSDDSSESEVEVIATKSIGGLMYEGRKQLESEESESDESEEEEESSSDSESSKSESSSESDSDSSSDDDAPSPPKPQNIPKK